MEKLILTTPITTPNLTEYQILRLDLNWGEEEINITLVSNNGIMFNHKYIGGIATQKMIALNKANLSIKSLHKRIIEALITEEILPGTVSGSPD